MGHSSGAHVATLLGTNTSYLERAGINISNIHGVIALDGSNYNAMAEMIDSPGPIAEDMLSGLGSDPQHLRDMSPLYHARSPNARGFLFLHVQRQGDIRQAVEFAASLNAAGTRADLHVFEGEMLKATWRCCSGLAIRAILPHLPWMTGCVETCLLMSQGQGVRRKVGSSCG